MIVPAAFCTTWLLDYITACKAVAPGHLRISRPSTSQFTAQLKLVRTAGHTSYSPRHLRIREIIQDAIREDGSVDWAAACSRTLHRSEKCLRSVYDFASLSATIRLANGGPLPVLGANAPSVRSPPSSTMNQPVSSTKTPERKKSTSTGKNLPATKSRSRLRGG